MNPPQIKPPVIPGVVYNENKTTSMLVLAVMPALAAALAVYAWLKMPDPSFAIGLLTFVLIVFHSLKFYLRTPRAASMTADTVTIEYRGRKPVQKSLDGYSLLIREENKTYAAYLYNQAGNNVPLRSAVLNIQEIKNYIHALQAQLQKPLSLSFSSAELEKKFQGSE